MNHCPLSRALFLRVHLHFHFMSDYTNYAQFNAWTFTGRVLATKVLDGAEGEFMAVTMITTLLKDGPEVTIGFTTATVCWVCRRKVGCLLVVN